MAAGKIQPGRPSEPKQASHQSRVRTIGEELVEPWLRLSRGAFPGLFENDEAGGRVNPALRATASSIHRGDTCAGVLTAFGNSFIRKVLHAALQEWLRFYGALR